MSELEVYRKPFELALRLLLQRWAGWSQCDEMRALHIGFDSFNTEICVSLLTNREPRLAEKNIEPLEEPWPVGDWRLFSISSTGNHCFPDAASFVEWMSVTARSGEIETARESEAFNEALKSFIFEVATEEAVLSELQRFRWLEDPFLVRVQWYFEEGPSLGYEMHRVTLGT